MNTGRRQDLRAAQRIAVELVSDLTGCTISLFEKGNSDEVSLVLRRRQPVLYCDKLCSSPRISRICEADRQSRAEEVMLAGEQLVTVCFAGMLNPAVPILVGGETRAVLLYGQLSASRSAWEPEARRRHEELLARLNFSDRQRDEIRRLYESSRTLTDDEFATTTKLFYNLQLLLYQMLSDQDAVQQHLDDTIHDLQTRLQPILAHAETMCTIIGRSQGSSMFLLRDLKSRADNLLDCVLQARTLVHNLGNFMPECQSRSCSLADLLAQSEALYRAEADRRGVRIIVSVREPSRVYSDEQHLLQAFNNLMHNAIKYSFSGSIDRDRTVRVLGRPAKSQYIITFENYGVGIHPHEKELIFEPGYKGKLTAGEYRSGAGLGLTNSKRIIEEHGGMIEVFSGQVGEEVHKNHFVVRLPRE